MILATTTTTASVLPELPVWTSQSKSSPVRGSLGASSGFYHVPHLERVILINCSTQLILITGAQ